MIFFTKVKESCSCNNCHSPNYYTPIATLETVDELFDLQIGSCVVTLCRDCIRQLSLQADMLNGVTRESGQYTKEKQHEGS